MLLPVLALALLSSADAPRRVSYDELVEAMRPSRGYDVLATTNAPRFQSEWLFRLVRGARGRDPGGGPLLVGYDEWCRALQEVTGRPPAGMPLYVTLAWKHRQDMLVEHRPGRVVREVRRGPTPALALSVTLSWPDAPGALASFSYEDALATPKLRVTNARVITYRLLDLGDSVLFDDIHGVTGRPTSGALGLLFDVIGDGRMVQYRMAVSPGGITVARGRARKLAIEVAPVVTVQPNGHADRGVPPDPGLRALEERIRQPVEVVYQGR